MPALHKKQLMDEQPPVPEKEPTAETLPANPSPPIESMEVHHHPQIEKKNLKEYLLEGLMIFMAVTMGFFAEKIRENITEHERAGRFSCTL